MKPEVPYKAILISEPRMVDYLKAQKLKQHVNSDTDIHNRRLGYERVCAILL
jgi:hypothetical protein